MDHTHSYSFPGFAFLLAQLTYRFVPYGIYILAFILTVLVLSGSIRMIYQLFRRLSGAWQRRTAAGRWRAL
jgi:hypothetical protein